MSRTLRLLVLFLFTVHGALFASEAFAACSTPTGAEGEIVYNSTYHVTQYCDGTHWISMAAAATYLAETDPKVGTLTALKWCATNAGGTAIDCTQNTPLIAGNNLSDLVNAGTARTNLGLGTIATQAASAVAITGGTINGTPLGGTTPAAGAFTTLSASGAATLTSTLAVTGNATFDTTTLKVDVSTHRVGVGSASPAYTLDVSGKAKGTSFVLPTTTGFAAPTGTGSSTGWAISGSNVIFTGGNVGIGTTTAPAQKLSVVGTIESTSGGFKFPDGTTQTTASAGSTATWHNCQTSPYCQGSGAIRAINTWYNNNQTVPLQVIFAPNNYAAGWCNASSSIANGPGGTGGTVTGPTFQVAGAHGSGAGVDCSITFAVPVGGSYNVSSGGSINYFNEMY